MYLKIGQILVVKNLCTTYVVAMSNCVGCINGQARQKRQTSNTAPSFAQNEYMYRASVLENQAPGLSVIVITATDPDQGENGKLTYSMTAIRDSRSNDMFTINPISGIVTTTTQLDREDKPRHDFRVTATDNNPLLKKSAVATLIINVEDENDNTPTFDQAIYRFSVIEEAAVGTKVGVIKAVDYDAGVNGQITYELLTGTQAFVIDNSTGEISTNVILDREVFSAYSFEVRASDNGVNKLQDTAGVIVTVEDVNDNPPHFMKPVYEAIIRKPVISRERIITVHAQDADFGINSQVRYKLFSSSNTINNFEIDYLNGAIYVTTSNKIDKDSVVNYTLIAVATDLGVPPLSTATEVRIKVEETVIPVG